MILARHLDQLDLGAVGPEQTARLARAVDGYDTIADTMEDQDRALDPVQNATGVHLTGEIHQDTDRVSTGGVALIPLVPVPELDVARQRRSKHVYDDRVRCAPARHECVSP